MKERFTQHLNKPLVFCIILTIACMELLNTAWFSDDFLITMRTILNFINGYGPVFNIDERVQAYTHPLWFLLITCFSLISKNVLVSMYTLSISISLYVFWLLIFKIARSFGAGLLGACILLTSKAYVDFSTSGLENPLSHLLMLITILYGLQATEKPSSTSLYGFFLICSLVYLNRPDLSILIFPLALLVMIKNLANPRLLIKTMLTGALPCVIWTMLSLYYYGFPFPNTAYAKLGTGIPLGELILQGIQYCMNSLIKDPLTLVSIVFGTCLGLSSSRFDIALSRGICLYFAYILSIGGDFMSGRFFTAPLLIAVVLIARSNTSKHQLQIIAIFLGILALINIEKTVFSSASYNNLKIESNGIADERGFYFQHNNLLGDDFSTGYISNWHITNKAIAVFCGGLGAAGIALGPGAHLIDNCALADPLLARLPAKYNLNWRIGHFVRELPQGYITSIQNHTNALIDPKMKQLYAYLRTITRGPLNEPMRIRNIVRVNLKLNQ